MAPSSDKRTGLRSTTKAGNDNAAYAATTTLALAVIAFAALLFFRFVLRGCDSWMFVVVIDVTLCVPFFGALGQIVAVDLLLLLLLLRSLVSTFSVRPVPGLSSFSQGPDANLQCSAVSCHNGSVCSGPYIALLLRVGNLRCLPASQILHIVFPSCTP